MLVRDETLRTQQARHDLFATCALLEVDSEEVHQRLSDLMFSQPGPGAIDLLTAVQNLVNKGEMTHAAADYAALWLTTSHDAEMRCAGVQLLALLMRRGSLRSTLNLAAELALGCNLPRNPVQARQLRDHVRGSVVDEPMRALVLKLLGDIAREGRSPISDHTYALDLYRESAELGSAQAAFAAALYLQGKVHGQPESLIDLEAAACMHELAIGLGEIRSQTNLGLLHVQGLIRSADAARGLALIRRAAAQGDALASRVLLATTIELDQRNAHTAG